MYTCTVCGFDKLKHPPMDHAICPCCGTQFGLDDEGYLGKADIHRDLRKRWIAKGARWYSRVIPPPPQWNPWLQLYAAYLSLPYIPWIDGSSMTITPTVRVDVVKKNSLASTPSFSLS
jgi:hypothetical protein